MTKRFIRKNRQGVLHSIELNVRDFRAAFRQGEAARLALWELRRVCDRHPAKLIAYVVMPTHLHCIINPRDGDAIELVRQYKSDMTVAYDKLAEAQGWATARAWLTATSTGHRQLWQDGKHDFHLWTDRLIWQKIDYLHNNPIKAGLARHAAAYPYSSFPSHYGPPDAAIVPIDRDFWWEDINAE